MLVSDERFVRLGLAHRQFNPFAALGIQHRELSHSQLLAWMLTRPDFADFRVALMSALASKSDKGLADDLLAVRNVPQPKVYTELGRIDVLLDFGVGALSIGIENKIWAGEQDRQLERYQRFLELRCLSRNQNGLIVFLTPHGGESTTALPRHSVPVVPLSWSRFAELIEQTTGLADSEILAFRSQIVRHIREDIMGDTIEKQIVVELLKHPQHRQTIRKILENLPTLADFQSDWQRLVQEHVGDRTLTFTPYRQHGEMKEIKVTVDEWCNADLPFCFMLYNYDDSASVRTLVYRPDLSVETTKIALTAFGAANSDVIDPKYPDLEGDWYWRSVFVGETSEPTHEMSILDEDFLPGALSLFREQFDMLAPLVDAWIAKGADRLRS
jgi:hypothetical protein